MTRFDRDVLPYGVFSVGNGSRRIGVAVEDGVLDLAEAMGPEWEQPTLNAFLAAGRRRWDEVRATVRALLDRPLLPVDEVTLHLPFAVADFADFYASEVHATNVGRIFRPEGEPLPAQWKQLPMGYHGRAGTVVVSGTGIRRPSGLRAPGPSYRPCSKLDVEVELGFVVGTPSALGTPVSTHEFSDHVFGAVVLNDWSARDIQSYEYVPLGPFLGKSFATSISPWVVPLEALQRVAAPAQDPRPADYLRVDEDWGLDVQLELSVNGEVLSRPSFAGMYWTGPQLLAHLTANGASLRTGDLLGSGTISGTSDFGSLIELTWDGRDGSYLQDGDVVTISARGGSGAWLGEVTGQVLPS